MDLVAYCQLIASGLVLTTWLIASWLHPVSFWPLAFLPPSCVRLVLTTWLIISWVFPVLLNKSAFDVQLFFNLTYLPSAFAFHVFPVSYLYSCSWVRHRLQEIARVSGLLLTMWITGYRPPFFQACCCRVRSKEGHTQGQGKKKNKVNKPVRGHWATEWICF
jgi:hypothetical protein